jgi:hypothetical protein
MALAARWNYGSVPALGALLPRCGAEPLVLRRRLFRAGKEQAMAYDPGRNPFNPLLIGAIAVVLALVAFLVFRDSSGTQQQAGISTAPPPATAPAPNTLPAPKRPSSTP